VYALLECVAQYYAIISILVYALLECVAQYYAIISIFSVRLVRVCGPILCIN